MNIIDRVQELMLSDDESRTKQARILLDDYNAATPEKREAIDAAMICICGYSVATLIAEGCDEGSDE